MSPFFGPVEAANLAKQITSTVVCGKNREQKINFIMSMIATIIDMIMEFTRAFDRETMHEIQIKLKQANYSKTIIPILEDWHPQTDWENMLKILLDLLLTLLHQFSPDDPTPVPPIPNPNDDLTAWVKNLVAHRLQDQLDKTVARALAKALRNAAGDIQNDPPSTIPVARAIIRTACFHAVPTAQPYWREVSETIADHLQNRDDTNHGIDLSTLTALWVAIANGIDAAAA